nr:MarR family transcriptional regulator [Streptomyces sp. SID3343]
MLVRSSRARLHRALTEGLGADIDEATYPVLSGLARLGPRTAAALACDIGLDRSVISRHATRLERAGLLSRSADPSDARATLLTLTDAGNTTVEHMRTRLADHLDRYFADWPEPQAQAFAHALRRFVDQGLSFEESPADGARS